jgi:PBSX family phage terminase large subunit
MNAPRKHIQLQKKYNHLFASEDWDIAVVSGGRGSQKSFATSLWVMTEAAKDLPGDILYTRYVMDNAKDSIIPEFYEKVEMSGYYDTDDFKQTEKNITCTISGRSIKFRGHKTSSGNQTAKLKSLANIAIWVFEEAEEMPSEDEFDKIKFSLRKRGFKIKVVLAFNPTDVHSWIYKRFFQNANTTGKDLWKDSALPKQYHNKEDIPDDYNGIIDGILYVSTSYLGNLKCLDESFMTDAERMKRNNLAKYENVLLGWWLRDMEGALWNNEMIEAARAMKVDRKDLVKIVVSVDPTVGSEEDIDDCGIVAMGKTADDRYLIIRDKTDVLTPLQWANATISLYNALDCNYIVAEINQGGDLVEMTIRNAQNIGDKNALKVVKVRATKGKLRRAEPVAALYEAGKVAHESGLEELEKEMRTYTGDPSQPSPGRLDALVWGLTDLAELAKPAMKIRKLGV